MIVFVLSLALEACSPYVPVAVQDEICDTGEFWCGAAVSGRPAWSACCDSETCWYESDYGAIYCDSAEECAAVAASFGDWVCDAAARAAGGES